MVLPGMLYGATGAQNVAAAIHKNSFDQAFLDDFVVRNGQDIRAKLHLPDLDDQALSPTETVNLLRTDSVWACGPSQLQKRVDAVSIGVRSASSVHTLKTASNITIHLGTDKYLQDLHGDKGDVDAVWQEAAHIRRRVLHGSQEQLYIKITE